MTLELWLAFTITAGILVAIPGPTNLMVMAYGLRHGTKPALFTVFRDKAGARDLYTRCKSQNMKVYLAEAV